MPEPKSEKPTTHLDSPVIAEMLSTAKCLNTFRIGKGKQAITCTTYATASGIVEFRDFPSGGWTMLTECPAVAVRDNVTELKAMQSSGAPVRGKGDAAALVASVQAAISVIRAREAEGKSSAHEDNVADELATALRVYQEQML